MSRNDRSEKQIPRQPTPMVLELGLRRKLSCRVAETEILGLHKPGVRDDPANLAHRPSDSVHLREQRVPAGLLGSFMRKPQSVIAAEPRRGERLIDRIPVLDPGIALGNGARIFAEGGSEIIREQIRVTRAAAVM